MADMIKLWKSSLKILKNSNAGKGRLRTLSRWSVPYRERYCKKKKKKNLCQSIKFLDIMVVRKCQETKDVTLKSSNPECKIEHYSFLKGKKKISITKIK